MATDSNVRSVTNTLSGTTADTITLTQAWPAIEITNYDAAQPLYFRQDGTVAVADADGVGVILPSQSKVVRSAVNSAGQSVISLVGSGNKYTVEGVH